MTADEPEIGDAFLDESECDTQQQCVRPNLECDRYGWPCPPIGWLAPEPANPLAIPGMIEAGC